MPYSYASMTNPFVGLPLGKGVLNRAAQLTNAIRPPAFTPWQRQPLNLSGTTFTGGGGGGGGTTTAPGTVAGPVTSPTGLTTQGATTISNTAGGPIPPSSQIQGNMTMEQLIALINSSPPPPLTLSDWYLNQNPMPSDSPSSAGAPGRD